MTSPMNGQVPSVSLEDLPTDLSSSNCVLLDVRESDEWAAGHAPDAIHIPMTEITQRLGDVPEAEHVYVVCRSGGRSAKVTGFLNANGWDAVNVERGMNGWAANRWQLVSEDPSAEPYVL